MNLCLNLNKTLIGVMGRVGSFLALVFLAVYCYLITLFSWNGINNNKIYHYNDTYIYIYIYIYISFVKGIIRYSMIYYNL